MGSANSRPGEQPTSSKPLKYGVPGDMKDVLSLAYCRIKNPSTGVLPVLIAVCSDTIHQFNGMTSDRRLRKSRPKNSLITCAAFKSKTSYGYLMAVGTTRGEVVLYDAATFNEHKSFVTNGSLGTAGRGSEDPGAPSSGIHAVRSAAAAAGGAAVSGLTSVTHISFLLDDTIFVGHSDGIVRSFTLLNQRLVNTYEPPSSANIVYADGCSAPKTFHSHTKSNVSFGVEGIEKKGSSVVGIVILPSPLGDTPPVLATAHYDGHIHTYDANSGRYLVTFSTYHGLTQLLCLNQFMSLATVHAGKNIMTVFDLGANRTAFFDFSKELAAVQKQHVTTTRVSYSDSRGVLMFGCDDGSVLVRSVKRDESSNAVLLSLRKVAQPASHVPASSGASTVGRSAIKAIYYDSGVDAVYAGDNFGMIRVIERASGSSKTTLHQERATLTSVQKLQQVRTPTSTGPSSTSSSSAQYRPQGAFSDYPTQSSGPSSVPLASAHAPQQPVRTQAPAVRPFTDDPEKTVQPFRDAPNQAPSVFSDDVEEAPPAPVESEGEADVPENAFGGDSEEESNDLGATQNATSDGGKKKRKGNKRK